MAGNSEELHFELMRLIEQSPEMTQREIAQALGISLGRVNYCLRALRDKGWVKAKNFTNSKNKIGYIYALSPAGVEARAHATVRFLRAKLEERERIVAEIERLRREIQDGRTKKHRTREGVTRI
ncbi:MAG: MarR family EPS-associated transcriptional regulator [Thermoanaerobaculia bacterium]